MSDKHIAKEIASKLYDLDVKVYESTVSTMGKVFPAGRELSVKHMAQQIEQDKKHFLKDETTLISNMINTIEDNAKVKEYRAELDEIRKMIDEYIPVTVLPDSFLSNISNVKNRFAENNNMIICIGREYGSGGHEIGYRLAERLNISYYDNEIIKMASEHFNANIKVVSDHDEKAGKESFFDKNPLNIFGFSANDSLFFAQSAYIQEIASKGNAVIMGRCSDVVLEHAGIPRLSIFIGAPFEDRVEHEMACSKLPKDKAMTLVHKKDKERKAYYNYYTSRHWGHSDNYDLCINTACYGIDGTVDILEKMVKLAYGHKEI